MTKVAVVFLVILGAAVAITIAAVAFLYWQGTRKPAGTPQYVALGSSFAAGIGLGDRVPGSPVLCQRTINSYPQQLARLRGLSIVDMTCAGATTGHVRNGGQYFQGAQLDGLSRNTELVTMTVGGNDIGYVGDLTFMAGRNSHSVMGKLLRQFWKGPRSPERRDYGRLHQDIVAAVHDIRSRSPHARIIVVGYPVLLPPAGTCAKLGIDAQEADMMRAVGERLSAVTGAAANKANASFVDMQRLSVGHDACSSEPWVNGAVNPVGAPYHPTLAGAAAVAQAIAQLLDSPPTTAQAATIAGNRND